MTPFGWNWATLSELIDLIGGSSREVRRRAKHDGTSVEVVAEGLLRSVQIALDNQEDEGVFERWDAIPPGFIDLRVFDQGEWWVDVLRRPHAISSMSTGYLKNVATFLLKDATFFCASYFGCSLRSIPGSEAEIWLEGTQLMIAIRLEITRREDESDVA